MASKKRVFFVNRFYYPDFSATAQILTDVAEGLVRRGWEVHIITSRLTYDGSETKLPKSETINGVEVHRVSTTGFGRAGVLGRAFDYLSFYFSSVCSILKRATKRDVVVAKTDPPILGGPIGLVAQLKGAKRVNWLQDIYPEVAEALGVKLAGSVTGSVMRGIRDRALKKASKTVVIGDCMAERVTARGISDEHVVLLQNFTDDEAIQPLAKSANALRTEWGYKETDFVIGYSGNLGQVHDVDTMLGAAELLADKPHIKFLFIGGGKLRETLGEAIKARGLTNIQTYPYQPRDQLRLSLTVADVHWASLMPVMEGLILPSKLYGIAAAGRPLIMVGDRGGDIGRILQRREFGITVPMGDSEGFARAITELETDAERYVLYASNARAFIDQEASRKRIIDGWAYMLGTL